MRSSVMRWVVGGAVALGLVGLSFKAGDLFGPAPQPETADRTAAAPPARTNDGKGGAPTPNAGADHKIAEPLDSVHALVGKPSNTRKGEPPTRIRATAVGAGPRARRRSTARAALGNEADLRGPLRPSGTGAIVPGVASGERATPKDDRDADGIVFDSGDVSYPTDKKVAVANVNGIEAGTVSFWLQPQWVEGNRDDAAFIEIGDALHIVKLADALRFEALKNGAVASGVGAPIAAWKDGEWHQVTATWSGSQLALYFDGMMMSRQQRVPPVELADNAQLVVGSSSRPGRPAATGVIGQLGLENRALAPREVQERFMRTLGQ